MLQTIDPLNQDMSMMNEYIRRYGNKAKSKKQYCALSLPHRNKNTDIFALKIWNCLFNYDI
jgi:hypothetical protein